MTPETMALLALLDPHHAVVSNFEAPRVAIQLTGDETPTSVPFGRDFPELPTCSTSSFVVSEPLVDLVRSATAHVQAMAVLPGDEKADEVVERLLAKRPSNKRPLRRK